MQQKELLAFMEGKTNEMLSIAKKKNSDYSKELDALKNFKIGEELGIGTTEQGFLFRITDKLMRITNLTKQEAQVKDESIEDTLLDLANYSLLFLAYLKEKNGKK